MFVCLSLEGTKMNATTEQKRIADEFGRKAFANGKKCVAAWDQEFMSFYDEVCGKQINKKGIQLLKVWNNAFLTESRKEAVA
jgi:hypothetical protein